MRSRRELVQVPTDLLARKIAAGEREVGGDVAIEPAEPLDLDGLEATRILAGPAQQALKLVPARAVRDDKFVYGGQ